MLKHVDSLLVVALLSLIGLIPVGCSSQGPATSSEASSPSPVGAAGEEEQLEGLAELTDAERTVALEQAVCPVSGAKLGSMGKPPKVAVNGQEVFICCAGCEGELLKNPDTHLAKLKSQ